MDQLSIRGVPAMGELREAGALEFSPGKVQQRPPLPSASMHLWCG